MSFTGYSFYLFFIACFVAWYAVPQRFRWAALSVMNAAFLASWGLRFLPLFAFSSAAAWAFALSISRCADKKKKKGLLAAALAAVCEEKGIRLIIVALPYREDVREYVIEPLGLEPVIESYKAEIAAFAELYDMEFDSDFTRSENFRDTTHFSASGQLRFLNALFRGDDEILIRRGPSLHTDVPRDKITE